MNTGLSVCATHLWTLVRQRVQDRVSAGVGYCGHVEKRRGTGEVGKDDDRRAVHG